MTALSVVSEELLFRARAMRIDGATIEQVQEFLKAEGVTVAYSSAWKLVSSVPGRREHRRNLLLEMIARGVSIREAAEEIGCAYTTAQRWAKARR